MAKVVVIGAGCSGVLVCRQLGLHGAKAGISEVVLYDMSGRFGPSLPYGQDTTIDQFILNMATSLLGVDAQRPDGFLHWIRRETDQQASSDSYVRRSLMGRYLASELQKAQEQLVSDGARLRRVAQTVHDIERTNSSYTIHTQDGRETGFETVILAVGHLKKRTPFPASPRYFANPYHDLDRLRASISPDSRVGILGTKLTAIDMAILLGSIGVSRIHIYSNSGRLPLVRGALPSDFPCIHQDEISATTMAGFLHWFRRHRQYSREYDGLFGSLDPLQRLRREIDAAQKVRDWQLSLDATKGQIDRYWTNLDDVQKRRFYRKYQGMWMSYRHPMPLLNAHRIEAMLQTGQLTIHRGYRSTRVTPEGKALVDVSDRTLTLDYVIDATGFPGNLARLDSPLIEHLLDRGVVKQYNHGGIAIDPQTHLADGQNSLYVIGPLTQGSLFYVSAIERLAVHAESIAGHLARSRRSSRTCEIREVL